MTDAPWQPAGPSRQFDSGELALVLQRLVMVATFSPMDLLFYGIAVYEGYKLSFRRVSPEDMAPRVAG